MEIKSGTKTSAWKNHPIANFFRRIRKSAILVFLIAIAILGATSLGSIYYGMMLYKSKKADSFDVFLENAIQTKLNVIPNYIKGMLAAEPERITIDIKHKNLQKIAYKRQIALDDGILLTSSADFVPAEIRYQDKTLKVKMRLKGDWIDHLLGEKWSFRIKVKGDNTLFGMKQFSIHHPRSRNFIYEWIYHQALKREDIINMRYSFVEVTLNGKDLGIYALEEHFEKRLIENNHFREGPIVKFSENLLWEDRALHHRQGMMSPTGVAQETVSSIDVFKSGTIMSNPALYKQFLTATTLLEHFRSNQLPFHKAFDVDKMATFFALSDLMGADHSIMWQNLRFYFNPVTSLLDPVGFDANAGRALVHVIGSNRSLHEPIHKFKDLAFSDVIFYEQYLRELQRLSAPAYLDEFFAAIDDKLQENLNIVYREFPYFHYTKDIFYDNQESIKYALSPAKGLHAYYNQSAGNKVELEVGNIHALPIEVLDVTYGDGVRLNPIERAILEPKKSYKTVDYRKVDFAVPAGFAWSDTMRKALKINYKVLGTSELRDAEVYSWPRLVENLLDLDFMRRPANFDQFHFLTIDEASKKVFIKQGSWTLNRDLIIPGGYQVICREGTEIDLTNEAVILSRSPLDFEGSEEAPIVIHSTDSTGQGVVVLKAREQSTMEYVKFNNLGNPSKNGWVLPGAVTFYESPVNISRCQFANNRCEDGLNIVRTDFTLDHSLFSGALSDAFDGDWVNGKISNTIFVASGNDAVDVSGSQIEVVDVFIDGAGDKGLSAGENSQMVVKNVRIIDSEIAVASKDMSEIKIDGIDISNCQIGFTLYQKKPEFDAAIVKVVNMKKENLKVTHLVEKRSKLIIDGSVVATYRENVKDLLYGVQFGKASERATN